MRIAIIGAGIAGVLLVQHIKKKLPEAEITLIDDNDYFVFTARLTEVLAGIVPEKYIVRPTKVFEHEHVHVIISRAETVDLKKQIVYLKNGQEVPYDTVVFAQGARTNFFGIKNAEKECLQYKDYDDVTKLREQVIAGMRELNEKKKEELHISVVGGGPTGTELLFAIRDLIEEQDHWFPDVHLDKIKIHIFQGGETLCKGMHPKIIKKAHQIAREEDITVHVNARVVDVKNKTIFLKEGEPVESDIIVWAAGVVPNLIDLIPKIELDRGGIPVRQTLQLKDYDNAFAIGDCGSLLNPKGQKYPLTAQIATRQAVHAAANIVRLANQKPLKPFTYLTRGAFLALGHHRTAARVYFLVFSGMLAWILRDQYYKSIFRQLLRGK